MYVLSVCSALAHRQLGEQIHQSPSQSAADYTPGKLTAAEDIQAGRKGITLTECFLVPISLDFTPSPLKVRCC